MKDALRYPGLFFSKTYLCDRLLTLKTLSVFFSVLGAIWLILRFLSFLSTMVDTLVKDNATISFVVVIILGLLCTIIYRRPEVEIKEKVRGFDTFIKIKVGDVLEGNESCVISTNTTFDTDVKGNLISADSLQGKLTKKFYNSVEHLDTDINKALQDVTDFEDISGKETKKGKTKKYPLGLVVKVTPKDRTFYLLPIANLNTRGNAECNFQMLSDALNSLWQFLGEAGDYEQELLIPVLGKGAARVKETREEIIQEIINSFIAASTEKQVCETLSIVIHSRDFYKFNIKMEDLKHYLSAQCRYSRIRRVPGGGSGESQ